MKTAARESGTPVGRHRGDLPGLEIRIYGSKGATRVEMSDEYPGDEAFWIAGSGRGVRAQSSFPTPDGRPWYETWIGALIDDAVNEILGLPHRGDPTFADGARAQSLLAAMLRSMESGDDGVGQNTPVVADRVCHPTSIPPETHLFRFQRTEHDDERAESQGRLVFRESRAAGSQRAGKLREIALEYRADRRAEVGAPLLHRRWQEHRADPGVQGVLRPAVQQRRGAEGS